MSEANQLSPIFSCHFYMMSVYNEIIKKLIIGYFVESGFVFKIKNYTIFSSLLWLCLKIKYYSEAINIIWLNYLIEKINKIKSLKDNRRKKQT